MLSDPPDATLPDDNDDTPHGLSRRHLLGLPVLADYLTLTRTASRID